MYCSSATLSNCGNTLKLVVPNADGNIQHGQGNDLGYGKNLRDVTMDNPQPSPKDKLLSMDAVHRLNGDGQSCMLIA